MTAKIRAAKGGTPPNRIRFILLEASLSDANLGELTQAITSALRPVTPIARLSRATSSTSTALDDDFEATIGEDTAVDQAEDLASARSPQQKKANRKHYKPKILKDVDLESGDVGLAAFISDRGAPLETTKRYLAIAAWFSRYGSLSKITADHIYTCYRSMDWALDIKDVGQPFRDIKRQGWGEYEDREFEINHVGLGQVQKFRSASASA